MKQDLSQERAIQAVGGSAIIAEASEGKKARWRVVYGETIPAWEQTFPTLREARAFAMEHQSFGDVIFSVRKVVPGEPPQSLTAAIEADAVDEFFRSRLKKER